MINAASLPDNRTYVSYRDLSGGLNTRKSQFNIERNQLSLSQNGWNQAVGVYGKRQGNINFASGATGSAAACSGMGSGRFAGVTSIVVQTNSGRDLYWARNGDANFTKITTQMAASSGSISVAQMADPDTGSAAAPLLFICNGKDIPWTWSGPAATTMTAMNAAGAQNFPTNHTGAAPITPKYCATLGSTPIFFMAGEPTEPCGVYISDAFFPRRYNRSNTLGTPSASNYQPLLVGFNDGIAGGDITGLLALGNSMIIYKQSAVYRLDFSAGLFGNVSLFDSLVDPSVGMTSPKSLVAMDGFHCFLSMDGVYACDGTRTQKISKNVPTFFDPAFTGNAVILDDTTAVGARLGPIYCIFYDAGDSSGNKLGYPNRGMWFNFDIPDEDGLPTCGEILGMNVVGAASLRGPADDGLFVWCNGASDQVGHFGTGYNDFGAAIQTTFGGKVDYMAESFDPGAPLKVKTIDSVWVEVAIPQPAFSTSLTFNMTATTDIANSAQAAGSTVQIPGGGGAVVGTAVVGTDVVAALSTSQFYQAVKVAAPYPIFGKVIGIQFNESSTFGWQCLGYDAYVDAQGVSQ